MTDFIFKPEHLIYVSKANFTFYMKNIYLKKSNVLLGHNVFYFTDFSFESYTVIEKSSIFTISNFYFYVEIS